MTDLTSKWFPLPVAELLASAIYLSSNLNSANIVECVVNTRFFSLVFNFQMGEGYLTSLRVKFFENCDILRT